ncbi:Ribosomal protein S18 acetylase RimI [Paenisporosarcina quisquiliarum]|uniref:GNAT family N-acetyltransferase n=1 Tax=Psychrobacillus psychrodurans TaxID=126157 RepID=UPI0008C10E73|nr:GNAT family N-acetyltransferase [Psychrobacillus psychrodurans]MCZ8541866.1 N-acetyltransferase [Psychrobacillus psychrodurans]SEN88065.1 Ribosomal protein S18 acetylase RimI [Paenisporosarcina quisquiliarum]SFN11521.1 Ribosomal protein S18 acetylase RimI [Psychrobacillus psychrodurans]
MGFIQITKKNIENEHICCALGAKQYEKAVNEKKKWLTERMDEGLVFYRLNERAKVFIEYLPAEMAWIPIQATNYMYINCLWVSGKYKNNGLGKQLLDKCKEDAMARGMDGIVHIVGKKKKPYLSEKIFFEYMGFKLVDQIDPYFDLVSLSWNDQAVRPSFKRDRKLSVPQQGVAIYYTAQCPFAVGILEDLKKVAENHGVTFTTHQLTTKEEAQNAPTIWTTFGLFYDGKFITHEMMSANKFEKLITKLLDKQL